MINFTVNPEDIEIIEIQLRQIFGEDVFIENYGDKLKAYLYGKYGEREFASSDKEVDLTISYSEGEFLSLSVGEEKYQASYEDKRLRRNIMMGEIVRMTGIDGISFGEPTCVYHTFKGDFNDTVLHMDWAFKGKDEYVKALKEGEICVNGTPLFEGKPHGLVVLDKSVSNNPIDKTPTI